LHIKIVAAFVLEKSRDIEKSARDRFWGCSVLDLDVYRHMRLFRGPKLPGRFLVFQFSLLNLKFLGSDFLQLVERPRSPEGAAYETQDFDDLGGFMQHVDERRRHDELVAHFSAVEMRRPALPHHVTKYGKTPSLPAPQPWRLALLRSLRYALFIVR
jgi:hypothetical protein